MSYFDEYVSAKLTLDDYMGLRPFFVIGGLLLLGLFHGVDSFCTFLVNIKNPPKKEEEPSDESLDAPRFKPNDSTPQDLVKQTILFFILLSFLLSPLATMIHLSGKRWNVKLYRSGTSGLFDLVHGKDPKLNDLMARMPNLLRGPKPPLLFGNRHLQFLPWLLQIQYHRQMDKIAYQRLQVHITPCLDKSQGICERSSDMKDTLPLDVYPPFGSQLNNSAPIVFFSHGLNCASQDLPGTLIVRRALGAGFRSVVVNRRGHTAALKAPRWNLFGDVDDLEQIYWYVHRKYAAPNTPFFLHGISSGSAVVESALAQWDQRRLQGDATAPTFVGSVSITPGFDIRKGLLPQRFKAPYNPILTESVKEKFIKANEAMLRQFDDDAVEAALAARHLRELVDATAPFAGYPNATAYYQGENPFPGMHRITTPQLVLNSIDDPCSHVHNIYEASPYPQHNGSSYAELVAQSPRGLLAVTLSGSHCPFLDTGGDGGAFLPSLLPAIVRDPYNGQWMLDSWADRIAIEFYQAALAVYGEERRHWQ